MCAYSTITFVSYREVQRKVVLYDTVTSMAFHMSMLPHCGNRYVLAACDNTLRLFDLEQEKVQHIYIGFMHIERTKCAYMYMYLYIIQKIAEFEDIYTSYCDCVEIIENPNAPKFGEFAVLTRGVEECNEEGLRMFGFL